ncbi:hypothetical protein, partial [Aporhodopirellula aestuarii]
IIGTLPEAVGMPFLRVTWSLGDDRRGGYDMTQCARIRATIIELKGDRATVIQTQDHDGDYYSL